MEQTGISLGDAMNLCNANNGGWNNAFNNPFMYLIWLAFFGNGGFGWGKNDAAAGYTLGQQTAELQNAIYASNDSQSNEFAIRDLARQVNQVGDGIASATYSLNNTLRDTNYATLNAINGVNNTVHDGFDKTGYALMENRFVGQQGITAIQQAIAETNYNNANNTCKITTAIHEEGEATRALINANTVQDLRDKLTLQSQALQDAKFALSQQEQNNYLVSKLGGCGCGCGCNY